MRKVHALLVAASVAAASLFVMQAPAAQAAVYTPQTYTYTADCNTAIRTGSNTDLLVTLQQGDTLILKASAGTCSNSWTTLASMTNLFPGGPATYFSANPTYTLGTNGTNGSSVSAPSNGEWTFVVRTDAPVLPYNASDSRVLIYDSTGTKGRQFNLRIAVPVAVTYAAQGGTGTMAPTSSYTADNLPTNTLTRNGYTFGGWNTTPTLGVGTLYADGASYPYGSVTSTIGASVTLFAMWTALPARVVTFDANGGTGSMTNQSSSAAANLTTNTFANSGFTFSGWNTAANGSGTAYTDAASFPFAASTTLYAQWTAVAPATPVTPVYDGPIISTVSPRMISAQGSRTVTISGSRLPLNAVIAVNGQVVKASTSTNSQITFDIPAGIADVATFTVSSSDKTYKFDGRVLIAAATKTVAAAVVADLSVSGFAGDSSNLTSAMKKQLDAAVSGLSSGATISCAGFASGPVAKSTDVALAKRRATAVCSYLKQIATGVVVSSATGAYDSRSGATIRRVEVRFTK